MLSLNSNNKKKMPTKTIIKTAAAKKIQPLIQKYTGYSWGNCGRMGQKHSGRANNLKLAIN